MARNVKKTARMPAMKFPKLQKRLRAAKIPAAKGRRPETGGRQMKNR